MPDPYAKVAPRKTLWRAIRLWVFGAAAILALISGPRSIANYDREGSGGRRAVGSEVVLVDWRMLAGLDHRTGRVSEALQEMDGREVGIPGFMVPLEDFEGQSSEFLFVPWAGACIHTPPPPPNQMVYVRMENGLQVPILWWQPVWIIGTLEIETMDSVYGAAGFQLRGTRFEPYRG